MQLGRADPYLQVVMGINLEGSVITRLSNEALNPIVMFFVISKEVTKPGETSGPWKKSYRAIGSF